MKRWRGVKGGLFERGGGNYSSDPTGKPALPPSPQSVDVDERGEKLPPK